MAKCQVFAEWMSLDGFVKHCDSSGLSIRNDSVEFRNKYFDRNNLDSFSGNGSLWPDRGLFELMALAQHHGFPTRLLDWSRRSYVAAYFAASDALARHLNGDNPSEQPFAVWALNVEKKSLFRELEIVRVPGGNSANIGQ
jgi:hypothetical protein